MKATITAIGGYVPSSILDNKTISETAETTESWIKRPEYLDYQLWSRIFMGCNQYKMKYYARKENAK